MRLDIKRYAGARTNPLEDGFSFAKRELERTFSAENHGHIAVAGAVINVRGRDPEAAKMVKRVATRAAEKVGKTEIRLARGRRQTPEHRVVQDLATIAAALTPGMEVRATTLQRDWTAEQVGDCTVVIAARGTQASKIWKALEQGVRLTNEGIELYEESRRKRRGF